MRNNLVGLALVGLAICLAAYGLMAQSFARSAPAAAHAQFAPSGMQDAPTTDTQNLQLPVHRTTPPPQREFRIGYAYPDQTDPLNDRWFRDLQHRLNQDVKLAAALDLAGYSKIVAVGAEGHRDLIQRMENTEFDCVFCPSVVFKRQKGEYKTVLQVGPGEVVASRPDGGILLKSCLIIGPEHPLFGTSFAEFSREEKLELASDRLKTDTVACVSRFSATGYLYLWLKLWRGQSAPPPPPYFCGSSEAVIKSVATGLVDMGICEYTALNTLIGEEGPTPVKIILETDYIVPADPIVLRKLLVEDDESAEGS